ncbi:MAG: hypothetical protein CL610_08665 [Anaerolineaceae bacterium]|nr:hypothetical protein [Anaerolineaceae bacterium]
MKNGKIVTVTLHPSLDKTLIVHHLNIGYHNRVADTTHLDASGRGMNVSRAAARLGVPTHAVVLLGGDAVGHAYRGLMGEESFPATIIGQDGQTRSDTIIVHRGSEGETHIIDEGAGGTPEDIERVAAKLKEIILPDDMVVLAGLLPRDASPDAFMLLENVAHEAGAHVTLMTASEALSRALKATPELVVLTRLEAESLFNYPVRTDADMISGGHKLREQGTGRVIIVADDFSSAVLIDEGETWLAEIDETGPGTDSGVVDALLAGYLAGLMQGHAPEVAFRLGAAAMNFADSQIGNEFGTLEQLHQYERRVHVRNLEAHNSDPSLTQRGA